jgi:hypothetical protein
MSMSLNSRARATDPAPPRAAEPSSVAMTHAMLRGIGIVMLVGIAVIHVVQLVPTSEQMPLLGVAYIMLIIGAVAVGVHLVRGVAFLRAPMAAGGRARVGGHRRLRVHENVQYATRQPGCRQLGMHARDGRPLRGGIVGGDRPLRHLTFSPIEVVTASVGSGALHGISDENGAARRGSAAWN